MEKNEIKSNIYDYANSSEAYTLDREKIAEVLGYPKIPSYIDKFESEDERKWRVRRLESELFTFVDNYLLSLFGVNVTVKKRNPNFIERALVSLELKTKRDFEFKETKPKISPIYTLEEITQKINSANLPLKAEDLVSVNTSELVKRIEEHGCFINDTFLKFIQNDGVKLYAAVSGQGVIYYTFTKVSNSEDNIKYRLDRKIDYFGDSD